MYIEPKRLEELEREGYSRTDIYTALSLANKTGIPQEHWLAARKQGKEWPVIIEELANGIALPETRLSDQGRALSESEMKTLMEEGFSGSDILAAGRIVNRYGGDHRVLLRQHADGVSWADVDKEQGGKWRQSQEEKKNGPVWFALGEDGLANATPSGLTKQEITQLLTQGYALKDILSADHQAHRLGLHIRDIAPQKPNGKSLVDAVKEARKVRDGKLADSRVPTRAGLTTDEVNALLAGGYTLSDIATVDVRAYGLNIDLRQVLRELKTGENLQKALERAERMRTPAERAAWLKKPHPLEEEDVQYYAKQTGRSEQEIRALRTQRKSWVEIAGWTSPDGKPSQYDVADSWGMTDHILIERAVELGMSLRDVQQVILIAATIGTTAADVLAHKTPDTSWADVIKALTPAKP